MSEYIPRTAAIVEAATAAHAFDAGEILTFVLAIPGGDTLSPAALVDKLKAARPHLFRPHAREMTQEDADTRLRELGINPHSIRRR